MSEKVKGLTPRDYSFSEQAEHFIEAAEAAPHRKTFELNSAKNAANEVKNLNERLRLLNMIAAAR